MSVVDAAALDPAEVFDALSGRVNDLVWLDSAVGDPELGRRSILALELAPAVELHRGHVALWNERGRKTLIPTEGSPWRVADAAFRRAATRAVEPELGWVGYVSYEAAHLADRGMPRPQANLPFASVRFDRVRAALVRDEHGTRIVADDRFGPGAAERRDALADLLANYPGETVAPALELLETPDADAHRRAIDAVIRATHEGRIYQACYTFPLWLAPPESMPATYRALREVNPGDYGCFLRLGHLEAASVSPERFLQLRGREVVARPMKGTRRRIDGQDDVLRDELRRSVKDRAENVMIVDLLRNDLGRVCEVGSVDVPSLFDVETYATVHQLTSTVTGTLRADVGPFSLLAAAFPPGSMTGAPKVEACRLIDEIEHAPRGLYAGSIAWLGFDGETDCSVVIRTLQSYAGIARYDVGGGIVADSDPDAEWAEALAKAAPIVALLDEDGRAALRGGWAT